MNPEQQPVGYLQKLIPGIGQLFRTNTDNNRKTEMLVLITPYIVADDHDAQEITDAFRNQLGEWAQPKKPPAPSVKEATASPAQEEPDTPAAPVKSGIPATESPAPTR